VPVLGVNVESLASLLHVLSGHFGTVGAVAFSPDGRWVVTAGPISAGLWPTPTGRLLFYLLGDTSALDRGRIFPRRERDPQHQPRSHCARAAAEQRLRG